ncbi:hypothetical protein BS47DRAFT_93759 [Hydnum rufescens UP504]|uniref:Uncharacterized protein n=1 Tax=Hydnum rufescens UP504 TaxID=1448309 RepID=A0A9P6DT91_9AGAM|nr:hypothetical protein BS47DRAFT_93759 [Hydnum rufescens UP504]
MSAVEQPYFEFTDSTLGIQDSTISFSLSPSSWDHLEWQRKSSTADPPYTPSYASYNSPGSNQSGLSGQLDIADDDFEYMNSQRTPYNPDSPFSVVQHDEDEGYNPTHYSTGTEEFTLLEDHFLGHDQPGSSPQVQITAPPHMFAPRQTPDHSPASSVGELELHPRSRASSVSSYNASRLSPAPPQSVNESLAKLSVTSRSDSPDPRSLPPSPYVSSITITADAPSPPPSSTTTPATPSNGSKPLGRPLIIPPTSSISGNFGLGSEEFGSKRNGQTSQQYPSGYLLPPQNPSLHIAHQ